MKIAYLINYAGAGGSEKYVRLMWENAIKAGNQAIFIYNEKGALSDFFADKNVKSFNLHMSNLLDISAAKKLAAICKNEKVDLIHVQFPRENYIAILSKSFYNVKVIYTCHLLYPPQRSRKILNSLFTRYNKNVIAVCGAVKNLLIQNGIKKDKVTVIYNGIVPNTETSPKEDIRTSFGIAKDDFLCVLLGRYTEEKGIDFLVDTFALLKNEAKCIILGEGPLFDQIKDKIKALGLENTVFQAGYRSNVFDFLLSSDVSLNSSNSEAFSFAILEGMAGRLPTVATDIGGSPEMLRGFLPCGEIVPYGDTESFKNAILKLKNDKELSTRYSENAYENLQKHFHLDKMIEETLRLYKEN